MKRFAILITHETFGNGNGAGVAEVNGKRYRFGYTRNVFDPSKVFASVKRCSSQHGCWVRCSAPAVQRAIEDAVR